MSMTIGITLVHVDNRWALTDTGECLHIEDLYDADGVETDDADIAVCGVAPCKGGFVTIDFSEFEEVDCYH